LNQEDVYYYGMTKSCEPVMVDHDGFKKSFEGIA